MNSHISELKKYILMIYQGRNLFLISSMVIITFMIAAAYFRPKIYEASSTVFIEKNMIDGLMKGITITPSMNDRIRVLRYYMLSRDLISRTLKEMDADLKVENLDSFEEMIKKYQQKTAINVKGDDLFIVSIRDQDPVFARNFINTLVKKYVEENIAAKREETFGANRFLSEQVDHFKGKLDEVQNKINDFRRERGIYVAVDEESIMGEISLAREELNKLRLGKNELIATESTIKSQLAGEYPIFANNLDGGSVGAVGGSHLAAMESRLDELLVTYTESYPGVIKLRAEIEAMKNKAPVGDGGEEVHPVTQRPESLNADPVYVDLKMKLFAVQSEIKAVEARERDLLGIISAKEHELNSIPEEKKVLAEMEREKSTFSEVYNQILTQVSRTEVSKQMEISDKATTFRIVDPAVLPTTPVNIDRIKLMLLGVLGGFLGGIAIVVLWNRFDGTFKELESLKDFGIPILAEIPKIANPVEDIRRRKQDRLLYGASFAHLSFVGALFVHDLLGLVLVDRFIEKSQLGAMFQQIMSLIN